MINKNTLTHVVGVVTNNKSRTFKSNTLRLLLAATFILVAVRTAQSQQTIQDPVVGVVCPDCSRVTNIKNTPDVSAVIGNITNDKTDKTIKYIFKLGGGISTPIEKEGVYNRDAGYNLNIGAGYAFTTILGGRFDMDYDLFRDPTTRGPSEQTPQFYMLSLKLGVMAGYFTKKKSIKIRPYAILGMGFHYLTDLDSANVKLMPSENDFSVFFGAGLCYMFTPQGGLFLESEYQSFLSGKRLKANIPVRIGIMFCPIK